MGQPKQIIIIGAGAAGIFSAIRCAEVSPKSKIIILESSNQILKKVKISGGGRCNVTHHIYDPKLFSKNYPRGEKEILSPLSQFQAEDTVQWFKERGIELKVEDDGRMFPTTNKSQTIINCFLDQIKRHNIQIINNKNIKSAKNISENEFSLRTNEGEDFTCHALLIATGSMPAGYRLAKQLGHNITDLAPSLFTFKINDPILKEMAGISFPNSHLKLYVGEKQFTQIGPLLITHWGLSGPALLKLSAWAAREMKDQNYCAEIKINWMNLTREEIERQVKKMKKNRGKISNFPVYIIPKRFWNNILSILQFPNDQNWSEISNKQIHRLTDILHTTTLEVEGKSRFKEEFVECGGVDLKEINLKKMESKLCPNLYFAGEILDIDGITGGFNFQNAWTTGWIAGSHLSK